ncbi:MAG: zinc ribbon domain-containing protein [Betaproteobacteria bacterium]|nr:zinc ribbon domain-containing protein [Betaproteobacteria bacterium]
MPIYEYRCSSCGFQKEYLQKVSAPLLSICPECSKETFGKMLTAAGFQLKGGGWYATDFKNSGARPAAKANGQDGTAAKPESKTETISESKREVKSDSKTEAKPAAATAPVSPARTARAE